VTPDKLVALIGLGLALILVVTNARLSRQPLGMKLWMAAAWAAIIIVAAAVFAGFRR
jgi:hypothetical protein